MKNSKMPVLFIGHGSPINAIEDNEFNQSWRKIARNIPKPKAILSISAHWETRGTSLTGAQKPPTIHDFVGFPPKLFQVKYPASGSPWLVDKMTRLLDQVTITIDLNWGFDHGTWSVLSAMFPMADVPVVQMSLNRSRDVDYHYMLGEKLGVLRQEGVLILGSGNLVHNLPEAVFKDVAFDWAVQFDANTRDWILQRNHPSLIYYEKLNGAASLAINTAEHYLPLLYVLGASDAADDIQFYCEKVTLGSVSMRCVRFG